MQKTDCIILGGGAAGLASCAALAKAGLHVTLVERLDRVGKKLMAAGNGRCNISNADMNPAYYGGAASFVSAVYETTPPQAVLGFLASLGLMTAVEDGRIYPRTMMAASVLDVLRNACACENVTLRTGEVVVSLAPSRHGGWSVQLASGEGLFAPCVIAALGGSAAPHLGTDGAGTSLMAQLGHEITALHPALVQLKCEHSALRSLKGIRVQAALTLEVGGRSAARETGELLFADYGVSGVCVFQLSGLAAKALSEKKPVRLLVNFLPEIETNCLDGWLDTRLATLPQADAQTLLVGVLPRLLAQAVLRQASLPPDTKAAALAKAQRAALIESLSRFPLPITGTQGFKNAQVTLGGVALGDVDPQTMASQLYDGLYIAGETLDVSGPCGGYNLHFAFASGLTAAKAITERRL